MEIYLANNHNYVLCNQWRIVCHNHRWRIRKGLTESVKPLAYGHRSYGVRGHPGTGVPTVKSMWLPNK